jgi:hypothetical protein
LTDLAAWLDVWADETDDAAYRRLRRALAQPKGGRRAIDDRGHVLEALALVEIGQARSLNQALLQVAKAIGPLGAEKATAERLRRKIKNRPRKSKSG